MDPVTQGLIGATAAQSVARDRGQSLRAGCFGFVAGLLADLDVLINSPSDPLLFLEYHRQFTHALVFIPVGGLIAALALHALFGRRAGMPFRTGWLYCTLGYGTHGLLDACTSYGTMLWWPFSDERVALNLVSVVDPLFTVPVSILVALSALRRQSGLALLALVWAGAYLTAGMAQRNAAIDMGASLAASRGHAPTRLSAKPSFANILVWKVIYETEDRFHIDAVRATVAPRVFPGGSVQKLDMRRDFPDVDPASGMARDVERFAALSDGFVAKDPAVPRRIVDVRYSMVPNEIDALWSIAVAPDGGPGARVTFQAHRGDPAGGLRRLWAMLIAPAGER